jgi:hypothetical protein
MAQLLQETSNLNAIRNMTKPSSIQDSFSERGTINSLVYLPSGDDKNSTLGAAKKFILFGNWNLKQGMQSKFLTKKIEQILEQDVLRLIVKACGNLEPYTLSCLVKFITKNIVKGAKRGLRKRAQSKFKK